jgi:plastocyanin
VQGPAARPGRRARLARLGLLAAALLLPAPARAADARITQKNRAYAPSDVTVRVGDTLVFVNEDAVKHNVHSPTDGFAFDLDVQRPGESGRVQVRKRGAFDVLCHIHPKMKLRVRVQ